ncbi:alpha/beta-hydrolase [Corynespora cassiicola Philippines]|uniref:Alpha/beta-hydrolase n=1 Tax=Corynespora cassiicola Philippines TaxID=1448308 RepID=A0A2T2N833_CORCC|nr:alpha/beta-hydrolase [Corynespora cassiicola Philippines]
MIKATTCQFREANISDISNTTYVKWVKSATIPSGETYRYVFSPPFQPEKPYLLFLHGFPESSYSWTNQIDYFIRHGYGVIAPDLLGTGGTDSPAELSAYRFRDMVSQINQLLDCEGVGQVIGVGHDFGTRMLSRIHTYSPERLSALAFVGMGYAAPGTDINEDIVYAINNATLASRGYTIFGYWLLTSKTDAASIIDPHLSSVYTLAFTENTNLFRDNFAQIGGFEAWLQQDRQAEIGGEYVSKVTQEQWVAIARAQGGLSGPLKWYQSMWRGINTRDEQENISRPGAIEKPTLLLLADRDAVGEPSMQLNSTVPHAQNLRLLGKLISNYTHFSEVC